jgi:hypothetical protein
MEYSLERTVNCLVGDPLARLQISRRPGQIDALDLLLLDSIDEALADLLGRRTREAVYDYLARNCLIDRNEIPRRLDEFSKLLRIVFGRGSSTIGKVIAKRLYAKLRWEFVEIRSYELTDYVRTARERVEKEAASHPIQT